MYITSKNGMGSVDGIPLKLGRHKYPTINSQDPLTALQLQALLDIKVIDIDETLPAEAVKEAADALDQGRMIVNSKTTYGTKILNLKGGKRRVRTENTEYLGSEITGKKKTDAGKPAKKSKKPRK